VLSGNSLPRRSVSGVSLTRGMRSRVSEITETCWGVTVQEKEEKSSVFLVCLIF